MACRLVGGRYLSCCSLQSAVYGLYPHDAAEVFSPRTRGRDDGPTANDKANPNRAADGAELCVEKLPAGTKWRVC